MTVKLVIDAIVRQTTVLIAQLATSAGMRAPLAHIANQTFLSLTQELERQGIAQKVIADMFGLALRSYQQKVQRLSESATDHGRSLWEALHDHLQQKQVVSRAEVLSRFARDDQASVRGILSDMVDAGLVYRTGRGDGTVYRVASVEELAKVAGGRERAAVEALVWVTVYREQPIDENRLREQLGVDAESLAAVLATLVADGRIAMQPGDRGGIYSSQRCMISMGESAGWEAALLDHYQTVVRAMCAKLNQHGAQPVDRIGGSTYSFDVWKGHAHSDRVYGLLAEHRRAVSALWSEISDYNRGQQRPGLFDRVTFYFGQLVTETESEGKG